MNKKPMKRLPLHRETLLRLSDGQIEQVQGGASNYFSCNSSCFTISVTNCETVTCNVQTQ